VRSTTPGLTGSGNVIIWTYSSTHGHVDSVKLDPAVWTPPVAQFTGTPTSGYSSLTVKFTDQSTNSPTSWSWDFGDGDSTNSTVQNPVHTYNSAGIYTVELTATNADGSDAEEKEDYITVTPYYVYAEVGESGTSVYNMAKGFWDEMDGAENGNLEWADWQSESDVITYDDAREGHWRKTTANPAGHADQYIEKADIAYFSGEGSPNTFYFENYDDDSHLNFAHAQNMSLGLGRTKWAVIDSCESLNDASWTNWQSSFNGLHILLGWNTSTVPSFNESGDGRGAVFAKLMQGEDYSATPLKMIDAWDWAGKYTWGYQPSSSTFDVFDAAIFDTNCDDDYLPGWGTTCTATSGTQGYQSTLVFRQTDGSKKGDSDYRLMDLSSGRYTLTALMPAGKTIMVYTPVKPEYTKEWVNSLAKSLGMSGDVLESEKAYFANSADAENNYFVVRKDAPVISFQKFNGRSGFPLSDDKSVSAVNVFLKENGLMSDDMLEPGIAFNGGESLTKSGERTVDWRTAVVTYSRQLNGLPVWNSQKMVELDSKGNVIGYFQNWREYEPYKEFELKSPEKAFEEFQKKLDLTGKGSPDKIVVTNVLLGYYSQPAVATEKYLQPIYVFEGYLQYGDSTEPITPIAITATDEVLDEIP
jgi:hypothetical protein